MPRLDDGFATKIAFAGAPSIAIYEKDVTPPGLSAGGAVDTTTMRNTAWRTASPKKLKTATNMTATVSFDTAAIPTILAQVGVKQLITITFPDLSTLAIWGWLDEFAFGTHTEGEQPTATITIIPSNTNAANAEVAPAYAAPPGGAIKRKDPTPEDFIAGSEEVVPEEEETPKKPRRGRRSE